MSGSGSTAIGSSATATVNAPTLTERALINKGTATFSSSGFTFLIEHGAQLRNSGTVKVGERIGGTEGTETPAIVNTGVLETTAAGTVEISVNLENQGTLRGIEKPLNIISKATDSLGNGTLEGSLISRDSTEITCGSLKGENATIEVKGTEGEGYNDHSELRIEAGSTATIRTLAMYMDGKTEMMSGSAATVSELQLFDTTTLTGAGTVKVSHSLAQNNLATLSGTGSTVILPGATASFSSLWLEERTLVNEGTATFISSTNTLGKARFINDGTADIKGSFNVYSGGSGFPLIVNNGVFAKVEGNPITVEPEFENNGIITEVLPYHFAFLRPVSHFTKENQYGGSENPSAPSRPHATCGDPISCATGNYTETQTDFAIGGRGVGLDLTRTYNVQAAAEGIKGAFGYGWTGSFSDHLVVNKTSKVTTLYQANGSTVPFTEEGGGSFKAPVWTQDTLSGTEGAGYTLTLANQIKYKFAGSSGRLESVTDRDGNATTLTYNEAGQLTTITDPVSRTIKLTYNGEGLVEGAEDPMMGYFVKYTYESGNLASVTQPAEEAEKESPRWQFKYNGEHEMTEMVDGRGGKTINEYNGSHQVTKQEDPAGYKLKFEYEAFHTTITNENTGGVTSEYFTSNDEPSSITRGYGTESATTESLTYDEGGYVTDVTNGDGHTTKYGYDSAKDRTSMVDPDGDETKWTYDSTHDAETMTTPKGETTTIKRESHGNPEVIERPAPEGKTQITKYKYTAHGELESVTNPLEHTWKYEYDSKGDRTAETDPEGNKRTWEYNGDSQEVATVSPRGNVTGGEPARFMTTIERDAHGRPVTLIGPLESFGSTGSAAGQFNSPGGEAIDAHGNVWVADTGNNRVEEFSEAGSFVEAIGFGVSKGEGKFEICTSGCRAGIAGSGSGQFHEPGGVASYSGTLYVVDRANGRVEEFNEKGEYIGGFGAGRFGYPSGVAASPSGHVWVTDWLEDRVEEFSSTGTFIEMIGYGVSNGEDKFQTCTTTCRSGIFGNQNGQFDGPRYLTFDGTNMYVSNSESKLIQEFNEKAEYVTKFGASGKSALSNPTGIAANQSTGNLYIANSELVKEVTSAGVFVQEYGRHDLSGPMGVAVNSLGTVYVVDTGNGRVAVWTTQTPLVTKYKYDANGNVASVTDPNGNKTTYTYNGDNEPIKVEEPNKTVTETEYDGAGQVVKQIDGNKHATEYKRNAVEEVTEVINPLGKKTLKEYDAAGNLVKLTDPKGRTTTYTYDPANRLTEVSYSSGSPSTVKYEYDRGGDRTKMTDGTGTTTYTYDQLDRLAESENGHKEVAKYEYDLANDQTKITYPNKKAVTRAFDKDGRLEKLTDWLSHSTKFTYDQDSDLKTIAFPGETKDEDTYAYNDVDQMSEVKMDKSTEVLASLVYMRDNDGQVKKITSKGLPGAEVTENTYDENNRLAKYGSTEYKYDSANNPTKDGSSTNTFNEGDELEKGTGTTFAYDELGERTKMTPEKGGVTTYSYDQAGNLISIERPEKESVPKIEDSYAYNGEGLRTSQTISGTTSYFAWDMSKELPLLLSDGTNSYIYGPGGIPVEQISGSETSTYLHHDQQGSIRLLTGSAGTTTGSITFDAYGNKVESTGTISPLGYDGQYTSTDTGLIYMRARVYDPSTAQFLTVDPAVGTTRAPYNYAGDNPLNEADHSGRSVLGEIGNFLEPLNPIKYYEEEIESYENGCGYFASVAHGLEGVVVGALDASGAGEEGLAAEGVEEGGTAIEDTLAGLQPGNSPDVYEVDSPEELQRIYDGLSSGGKPVSSSYPGEEVELPDGTRVGIRETSKSGGPTVDINQGGTQYKIHVTE
jgi:RHS repeat-associated protein